MEFDDILPHIGDFGRYQKMVYYFLCIPASLPAVFLSFNQVFLSASPDHWCHLPELESTNLTVEERRQLSVPREQRDGALVFSRCSQYAANWSQVLSDVDEWPPQTNASWPTVPCQYGWEYDKTYYDRTLVTDLNLVCDNMWWPSAATTAFYVGSLFGNVLFGWIADRWGRKLAFFLVLGLEVFFAVCCTFPPNYEVYTAFRTLLGLTFPAIFQIPFIIGIELMGPQQRTFAGLVVCIFFASAMSLLAAIAFLCRDWFKLALITSFPFVSLFGLWWVIPESPRWLLSKGRIEAAEKIIQKIAKTNKKNIPENFLLKCQQESLEKKGPSAPVTEGSAWGLIQTPNMRKKTTIITFNWLSNAVVYNGLSYMCANLGVSDYLAFFISGLVEIPSYIIVWYAMQRWGRRWSLIITQLIGGFACVSTMFVPEDQVWVTVTLSMIGKFGISGSFAVTYVFAGELYPTVVRAVGLAISSFVAGIGLIASPSLVYLAVYSRVLPLIIMGLLSVAGAVAVVVLPETLGCHLPQTLEEGEAFGKDLTFLPKWLTWKRTSSKKPLQGLKYNKVELKPMDNDKVLENGPRQNPNLSSSEI